MSKTYGSGNAAVVALREIDLEIKVGEFVVVSGQPNSGKTTLIELIGGSVRPTTGQIMVAGRRVDQLDDRGLLEFRSREIALAPQLPTLAPTLSAYETVEHAVRLQETARSSSWPRAVLEAVGLEGECDTLAYELSDEDQSRLSVARALAKNARLMLVDSPLPTGNTAARQRLMATLQRFARNGPTTMIVTGHDAHGSFADRVVHL